MCTSFERTRFHLNGIDMWGCELNLGEISSAGEILYHGCHHRDRWNGSPIIFIINSSLFEKVLVYQSHDDAS